MSENDSPPETTSRPPQAVLPGEVTWTSRNGAAVPAEVGAVLKQYARGYRWLRPMVYGQLLVNGGMLTTFFLWSGMHIRGGLPQMILMSIGLFLLVSTVASFFCINSRRRWLQVNAFSFAQMMNLLATVPTVVSALGVSFNVETGFQVLTATALVGFSILQISALVWLLWFYHLSQRVTNLKQQYRLIPKPGCTLTPWGSFELPLEQEEMEVESGWDSGGREK